MKALKELNLIPASVSTATTGAAFELREAEDTITLLPVTTGTVAMTLAIQTRNPDGTSWHQVATATYNAAGAQTPITLTNFVGQALRAVVSAHTNGGIIVNGFAGCIAR